MSTSSQSYLGASQNLVSSCSGSIQPLLSSQVALAGAVNFYPIQSGQIISLGALTAVGTITLPPVATSAGHTFTVVVNAAALGNTLAITAQSACMRGFVLQPAAVGQGVQAMNSYNSGAAAGTPVTYLRLNATAVVGDRVEIKCDGTSWFVQGWSGLASGTQAMTFFA
jgi:hypothetical protein